MGQMKKMKSVIDDLHSCSDYLNGLAAELEQMFKAAPDEGEAAPNELPTKEPGKNEAPEKLPLKFEDIRAVLADISRKGHNAEVRALIEKYGVDRLSAVNPKHYEALLRDAEVLHEG